jgi:hypothetical protein
MKKYFALLIAFYSFLSWSVPSERLEDLKIRRRFGVGITGGGPLSVLGIEADVNLTENLSISAGIGTGLDYSTFMAKVRYYLLGEWVSPYIGVAVARWWTDGTPTTNLGPSLLRTRFLDPTYDASQGFSIWLLSPAVGVQFMHPAGFAVSAEVQYFFKLFTFANGAYASLSAHWYF